MNFTLHALPSPMGALLLVLDEQHVVRALDFADHRARLHRRLREQYGACQLTQGTTSDSAAVGSKLERFASGPARKRWLLTHENAPVVRGVTPRLPGF